MPKRRTRTASTSTGLGSTLSVGPNARSLDAVRREIFRLFGPWETPESSNKMGTDLQALESNQIKWGDYYWDQDPLWSSGASWYGDNNHYKWVNGGQGGGNYYDKALQFYVLWARTGLQRFLDRANALVIDQRNNCFNGQGGFTFSDTPGGLAVTTTGNQSGVHTLACKFGTETFKSYDGLGPAPGGDIFNGVIGWSQNKLQTGDTFTIASTTGTLPSPLTVGTTYYVKDVSRGTWGAPGGPIHWNFRGVYCHWLVTGDPLDKICIGEFASSASHAFYRLDIVGANKTINSLNGDKNPLDERTIARCLETMVIAHLLQAPPDQGKTNYDVSPGPSIWKTLAKAYLDGILAAQDGTGGWRYVWVEGDQVSTGYEKPYQAGMVCSALIMYYNLIEQDPRIITAVKANCDCIWDTCFITPATYPTSALGVTSQIGYSGSPSTNCFRYKEHESVFEPGAEATYPAPNLGMFNAPSFAWIYYKTGDVLYRDRADKMVAGTVAYGLASFQTPQLNATKSYNEVYTVAHQYAFWRSRAETVAVAPPTISVAPSVSYTSLASGSVATTTNGTWSGAPTSYARQWQRSPNGTSSWVDISGQTGTTYTLSYPTDAYIRCNVIATNGFGSSSASSSNVIGPVTAAPTGLTYTFTGTPAVVSMGFTGPASFAGMAIGSAASDRRVVASLTVGTAGVGTNIAVTIGGVSASIDDINYALGLYTIHASAIVPTGTTATVVVSDTANANNLADVECTVGTIYGANPTTWVANTAASGVTYGTNSLGVTVPSGGVAVFSVLSGGTPTLSGTSVSQDGSLLGAGSGLNYYYGHATATTTANTSSDGGGGTIISAVVYQL